MIGLFGKIYDTLKNNLNEDFNEIEPDQMSNEIVKEYAYERFFKFKDVRFGYSVTYYPAIKSAEIRFIDIDNDTFKKTGKFGFSASSLFGVVARLTRKCLEGLATRQSLPYHIYFITSDRVGLYDKLSNHKTTLKILEDFDYIKDEEYANVIKEFWADTQSFNDKNKRKEFLNKNTIYCFTRRS